jgi:translation elongation factor EF-1beta
MICRSLRERWVSVCVLNLPPFSNRVGPPFVLKNQHMLKKQHDGVKGYGGPRKRFWRLLAEPGSPDRPGLLAEGRNEPVVRGIPLARSLREELPMSERRTVLIAAPALLLCLFGPGCRPSQTVERQTRDATLKAQVKAKLAADVGASTVTAVEVNVTNGVVTLAGPVRSDEEKQKAEAAARSVEGVSGVNNALQVMPESAPLTAPPMTTAPPTTPTRFPDT